MKGPALHVPSGHQQSGGGAHPLALQQPDGVGCPHKTVGAGNLLEGVGGSLLPQMVDQQQGDVVLIRQGFQSRHILVVGGIDSFPLVRHPHLLQGVNDHQPGVRVGCQEGFQLLFQAPANGIAGCLEVKSAWNRVLGELEQSLLNSSICIFQAKVEDRPGLGLGGPKVCRPWPAANTARDRASSFPLCWPRPEGSDLRAAVPGSSTAPAAAEWTTRFRRQQFGLFSIAFLLFFVSSFTQAPHWAGVPFCCTSWEEDWILRPALHRADFGCPCAGLDSILHHIPDHIDFGDLVGVAQLQPRMLPSPSRS